MAFCKNCGAEITDGNQFCPKCGTAVNPEPATPVTPTVEPTSADVADAQNNKVMGVLAYIGLLVLIPYFAAKESKFAQFHARQGITLCALSIAYAIAEGIISFILGFIFPAKNYYFYSVPNPIYSVITTILSLASIFFAVLAIIGIINAVKGETKKLPIIGDIDILQMIFKK